MRIIGGRYRRRLLKAPKGYLTRPSTDRVRESIFNLLTSRIRFDGARVLDLFAGTGALGLEALSRGAASATFVESNGAVLQVARHNAASLDAADACRFVRADAVAYLRRYAGPPFDVIFADPPYDLDGLTDLPELARPHLNADGRFVLEHDARHHFDEPTPGLDTSRAYGRTIVSIFTVTNDE